MHKNLRDTQKIATYAECVGKLNLHKNTFQKVNSKKLQKFKKREYFCLLGRRARKGKTARFWRIMTPPRDLTYFFPCGIIFKLIAKGLVCPFEENILWRI